MPLRITTQPHILNFKKQAGTSRGVLNQKKIHLVQVRDTELPGLFGYGECGPLPGLSVDDRPDFEHELEKICSQFNAYDLEVFPFNLAIILNQIVPENFPSIRFGIETALLDIMNGGKRKLYDNAFSRSEKGILMNGLIWMGTFDDMVAQVEAKLEAGFNTIKLKVGAIDFDEECAVLEHIRNRYKKDQIELRVDANGAFHAGNVRDRLDRLATYDLHSIEQPIMPGQAELMHDLCANSPVPIALDEELIGIVDYRKKFDLLKNLNPPYIILKPGLLGGLQSTAEWIEIAGRLGVRWWVTSALESNIGLNAIAQFTAQYHNPLPQGLGTGQLYSNNIDSPLLVKDGYLWNHPDSSWGAIF
ncbi:o-succinylbenzoate synthase [Dyadobacter tibetensis]|uniref:o-succinylbenzoate synthase n=1 Tax=Dyadobacter tibetensis TaxID=1211851 RepID=UPI0004710E3E|nr:o-succinylbenzoate synthase [Dyadobacter tibetensis]